MLLTRPTASTRSTEASLDRVSRRDFIWPWGQKASDHTQIAVEEPSKINELDEAIIRLENSVEGFLFGFLSLLNSRRGLQLGNSDLDNILKRYMIAILAISYVDDELLDRTLALSLQVPLIPEDGLDELLETVDEIRDFYECVNDPTTATPTVETFTLDLKQA